MLTTIGTLKFFRRLLWDLRTDFGHFLIGVGDLSQCGELQLRSSAEVNRFPIHVGDELAAVFRKLAKPSAAYQKARNTLIAITLMMSTKKAETNGKMMKAFGDGP